MASHADKSVNAARAHHAAAEYRRATERRAAARRALVETLREVHGVTREEHRTGKLSYRELAEVTGFSFGSVRLWVEKG